MIYIQSTLEDVPFGFGWDIAQHFEAADKHIMGILGSPKKELKQYVIDYLSDFLRESQDFDKKVAAKRGVVYKEAKYIVDMNGLAFLNETFQYKKLKEGFGWSDDTLRIFKALIDEVRFVWRSIKEHYHAYKF